MHEAAHENECMQIHACTSVRRKSFYCWGGLCRDAALEKQMGYRSSARHVGRWHRATCKAWCQGTTGKSVGFSPMGFHPWAFTLPDPRQPASALGQSATKERAARASRLQRAFNDSPGSRNSQIGGGGNPRRAPGWRVCDTPGLWQRACVRPWPCWSARRGASGPVRSIRTTP